MKLISQIIIGVCCLLIVSSCSNIQNNGKVRHISPNKRDTLKIGYLDTLLLGEQLFPTKISKHLINDEILLFFKSEDYYYAFYNKINKDSLLSALYWEKLIPKYVDFSVEDGLWSYSRFAKVNYYDPFLTGFYNSKDSIIISGFDLGVSDLQNQNKFQLNYLSTSDTLLKVSKTISVGKSIEDILLELKIPRTFKPKLDFELILMEAISQVDNAWYNDFSDHSSDHSITVILSVKNGKVSRIQYLGLEYLDYVFRQKSIMTKDIHYQ